MILFLRANKADPMSKSASRVKQEFFLECDSDKSTDILDAPELVQHDDDEELEKPVVLPQIR